MASSGRIDVLYVGQQSAVRRELADASALAVRAFDSLASDAAPRTNGHARPAFEPDAVATEAAEVDCVVVGSDTASKDILEAVTSRDTPVIVTGPPDRALTAFRAGATDYVPRGGDRSEALTERVLVAVRGEPDPARDTPDETETTTDGSSGDSDPPGEERSEAALRAVALDAATSLMSARPDELDTKVTFSLESLCDRLSIPRAATYVPVERHPDAERDPLAADGESADGVADDQTVADGGVTGYRRRHSVAADEPLPERPDEPFHREWIDRLGGFETVPYGPTPAHESGESLAPRDRSGIVAPMVAGWELAGFAVFDSPDGRRWSDGERRVLETVTELVAQALERKRRVRQLERQNDRLDRFAAAVSHDLRNPLNVADGWLDIARNGDREAFDRIERSLDRMGVLIDDLLTLARDGADVADTEPLAVEPVAREAWGRVQTDEATLSVGRVGEVTADESRLASLFENLFRNSVEHGGADVSVTVGPTPNGFYVADDGPGLPAETDDVFEWGETGGDGTGLGLAIVERVAEGHGWRVTATNDDGARFDFHLAGDD